MPRARAEVTKGWSRTFSNSSRVTWPMKPASGIASVRAGRIRPSMLVPPCTGSHFSSMQKTTSRITPSQ